jgi:hypothetical protein
MAVFRAELKAAAAATDAEAAAASRATTGLAASATGMQAAIAAGVALAPVITTLGFGLGGLALAATGLGRNSTLLAQELVPLKEQVAGFQAALRPTVLADFAAAAQLAGTVLHGVEPVAQATGKALAGLFGAVDAEFQSGTWQSFFGFMARTAGPDVALLGQDLVGLMQVLPPLIQALQPLAIEVLQDAGAVARLAAGLETAAHDVGLFGQSVDKNLSQSTGVSGVRSFGDLIGA